MPRLDLLSDDRARGYGRNIHVKGEITGRCRCVSRDGGSGIARHLRGERRSWASRGTKLDERGMRRRGDGKCGFDGGRNWVGITVVAE